MSGNPSGKPKKLEQFKEYLDWWGNLSEYYNWGWDKYTNSQIVIKGIWERASKGNRQDLDILLSLGWTNKKQLTSLYIGVGLGFIYGYNKFLIYLLKKGELFTDMDNWSDDKKYHFFKQIPRTDQNIIERADSNIKKKEPLSL